jgi:hypothetical protein
LGLVEAGMWVVDGRSSDGFEVSGAGSRVRGESFRAWEYRVAQNSK